MKIKRRLHILIFVTLLPVLVFGVAAIVVSVKLQRDAFENGALNSVRALMSAVDAELRATSMPLELLASSPALDRGDLAVFREEALRALGSRSQDWANIVVSDPESMRIVLDALAPQAKGEPAAEPNSILQAVRTRSMVVGDVTFGPVSKQYLFAVRVPAVRDGRVLYVVSAIVRLALIERLLASQRLPQGWASAVLDGRHHFVARQPAPPGGSEFASRSLQEALSGAAEGWQRGQLLDGARIYRAFVRSPATRWSASIAIPGGAVDQSLNLLWLLFAGLAGASALGLWIAWWLASRISTPLANLVAAAPALAHGKAPPVPDVGSIEEVAQLADALTRAADAVTMREQALRAADRAKDEFLAMLGHELRNPLASVSNAAQLLRIARDRPDVAGHATEILARQTSHMTRLVDDLLEVGRVTGGKIVLERKPLDLAATVKALIDEWTSAGRFAQHAVELRLEEAWLSGDRNRLLQIMTNLVDNSLKYTPAGGTIAVTVRREGGDAVLEVRDSGQGMPAELIERVFDLFVQGERTLAREASGLGIGLTMVKRLVELHGGSVEARSDGPAKGATLTARFPAIDRPMAAADGRRLPPEVVCHRIVVVEDNDDARESLVQLLQLSGHEVSCAKLGEQGLALARDTMPECMIVDIGLPDMDGYEVARRLKSDPATARIRLIALTGYGSRDDQRRAETAGFSGHATKPIDIAALEALLKP